MLGLGWAGVGWSVRARLGWSARARLGWSGSEWGAGLGWVGLG